MDCVMRRIIFCILVFILYPFSLPAKDSQEFKEIRGLAIVKIKSRRIDMEFEQAIVIEGNKATFVGLDDFGGEVFRIYFNRGGMTLSAGGSLLHTKGDKLKKILSLPLTQAEFLWIMKYQKPDGFVPISGESDVVWQKTKKKKLLVQFDGLKKTKQGRLYPDRIHIQYKKNYLDLEWIQVKLK